MRSLTLKLCGLYGGVTVFASDEFIFARLFDLEALEDRMVSSNEVSPDVLLNLLWAAFALGFAEAAFLNLVPVLAMGTIHNGQLSWPTLRT